MNKVEILCAHTNHELIQDILQIAEDYNIVNVISYETEDMHFKKRALVNYNE